MQKLGTGKEKERYKHMKSWMRHIKSFIILSSFVLLLSGCGKENLTALLPKGYGAESSYNLIILTTVVMSFVFLVVIILLATVLIRFRAKKGKEDHIPKQVEGSVLLEIIWTSIPIILVIIMAVPTVMAEFDLADESDESEHMKITVTGNQYWWHFDYEDHEVETSQDLYIPVGEKVYLDLKTSDVLHSFWVPSLSGKLDANPENVNTFYIEAYEEGVYYGKCAELCGPSHSLMDFKVVVVSQDEFDQWINDMQDFDPDDLELDAVAQEGKELFEENNCMNCHAVGENESDLGPDLNNFGNRINFAGVLEPEKEELIKWIQDPDEFKPGNKMKTDGYPELSDDEADKIAEYLMQLKATSVTPENAD